MSEIGVKSKIYITRRTQINHLGPIENHQKIEKKDRQALKQPQKSTSLKEHKVVSTSW